MTGQREVQLAALAGEQVVVEGLAQQRMTEAEVTVRAGHQNLFGQRFAQSRLELIAVEAGDRGDHRIAQGPPDAIARATV